MATAQINLPQGFVLDKPAPKSLPQGFVLDESPEEVLSKDDQQDKQINSRPSAIADMTKNPVDYMNLLKTVSSGPLGIAKDVLMNKGKAAKDTGRILSGGAELYEGVPASIGLDLQRAQPEKIASNVGKVLTGQRRAEYGDIYRGAGAPEKFSAGAGLATNLLLSPGGAEGTAGLLKGGQKLLDGTAKGILKGRDFLSKMPDKFFRGGQTTEEAARIESQYGNSNATLVDAIKSKLNNRLSEADKAYQAALESAPEGKQINIKPAIEVAGRKLKNLGLITKDGNLTELGKSEIARDSVYGKLLDFYKSADSISGVKAIRAKGVAGDLTINQGSKLMASRFETNVNKNQYTFFRDKLNDLYKGKPSDVSVSDVVNQFYKDGESSGIKGLQKARQLTREAFENQSKFLNRNTGDLKITEQKLSRVGTDKPLSKQELDHIAELEKYIGHSIIKDATSINEINKARDIIKNMKQYGKGVAGGLLAGEIGRKSITGRW